MVLVTHNGDNRERLEAILQAAQRRFGLYGFEKVTVSEIAADLNLSKASIYYYFQDKTQLFAAVVELEHHQFLEQAEVKIMNLASASEMLKMYVDVNVNHFKKMMNLTRIKHTEYMQNACARKLILQFRERECALIKRVLDFGIKSGEFDIEDSFKIASLFLDLLKGLRKISIGYRDIVYLNDEELEHLKVKGEDFVSIFIKGIKATPSQ
jgi:Transcriptional regulator